MTNTEHSERLARLEKGQELLVKSVDEIKTNHLFHIQTDIQHLKDRSHQAYGDLEAKLQKILRDMDRRIDTLTKVQDQGAPFRVIGLEILKWLLQAIAIAVVVAAVPGLL